VNRWCEAHDRARGAVLPIATVWELSKAWYEDRLSADYRGRTAAQAQAIFAHVGLASDFWALEGSAEAPQK
jgi:hypothetical protein